LSISTFCSFPWKALPTPARAPVTGPAHAGDSLLYGVVSAQTEEVVEFHLEREAAETMIQNLREDEPVLAGDSRVDAIELG